MANLNLPPRSLLDPNASSEPLPLYTPRRASCESPETGSIRSQAPSYVSEVPSYHSNQPSTAQSVTPLELPSPEPHNRPVSPPNSTASTATVTTVRLSSSQYAPGFRPRPDGGPRMSSPSGSSGQDVDSLYNMSSWAHVTEGVQARHVQNVAQRRSTVDGPVRVAAATSPQRTKFPPLIPDDHPAPRHRSQQASSEDTSTVSSATAPNTMSNTMSNTISNTNSSQSPFPKNRTPQAVSAAARQGQLFPHEDPELVGEEAATLARNQRLYINSHRVGTGRLYSAQETDVMRKQEARTWDFMLGQMADWEDRERSWSKFREDVGRTRFLRRLGVGQRSH